MLQYINLCPYILFSTEVYFNDIKEHHKNYSIKFLKNNIEGVFLGILGSGRYKTALEQIL